MEKRQLQDEILSQPYNREVWYGVLKQVFGTKVLYSPVQDIRPLIPDPDGITKGIFELGNFYTADERLVGIYEITLNEEARTKLSINKVGLRNLLRRIYKYDVDGALIVFVQGSKWRFSYVSEIRTNEGKKETEPKRYTYLFGKGESCRTAAERFLKLQGKRFYLEDLYDAFSVEKLNEDFFTSYKGFFEKFSDHLAKDGIYRRVLLGSANELDKGWKDDKAKPIRDFAKKLLGRVVFLQFLQKKGWIAVPVENKDWTGGDVNFLQTLFAMYKDKQTFHSTALAKLFFETLNTKRPGDIAPIELGNDIKIPYLNGGLFDKDLSVEHKLDFPVDYFRDLLDFFQQYNFTIDENDPYDNEVGIDPEMLGHIFENLLEENREKGAFYTPKEVVHFMCQQSLIEYLHTQLPSVGKSDIDLLVRANKVVDELTNYKKAQEINEKLRSIKICDPAIGSGAFPMGLLKEIFECRRVLYGYLKTNESFNPATIKKQIIQDNIYGVDREYGAVEIARLRFWLALVVDELAPTPLPNLDYKIMQGDSLLESFGGVDLSSLAELESESTFLSAKHGQLEIGAEFSKRRQTLLVFDEHSKGKLYELISDYFNYDEASNTKYNSKEDIKTNINEIVEAKLLAKFASRKDKVEKEIAKKEQLVEANKVNANDLKGKAQKKERNMAVLKKEIETKQRELNNINNIIAHLHEIQASNDKPYFLWHLWFKDVFDQKGFDIVIGNPPYIQLQKITSEADILENEGYETFSRSGDIYCLFYELGNRLLRPRGNLVFITSNSWLRTNYGKSLRSYLIEKTNPIVLIDLSDSNIFQSATVRTAIIQFKKEQNQDNLRAIRLVRKSQEFINELDKYFSQNYIVIKTSADRAWVVHEKGKAIIIEYVSRLGKPLKDWIIDINYGIKTGLNDAFVIPESIKNELIIRDPQSKNIFKKFLRGRDLEKYHFISENFWLIGMFPSLNLHIANFPAIEEYLLKFGREKLEQTGAKGARKKTGNEWFETQDQISYWSNFEKPKIMYPNIVKDISFTYDDEGYYVNDKCFILTGEKLKFLLGVLNSRLFRYCFEEDFPELQGNSREVKSFVMKEIPIIYPDKIQEKAVEVLVNCILFLNDPKNRPLLGHTPNNRIGTTIEEVLNMVIYELYFEEHMTEKQLNVIEYLTVTDLFQNEPTAKSILEFYLWLQQPENPIRNRILAVDIKSPEYISRINASTN